MTERPVTAEDVVEAVRGDLYLFGIGELTAEQALSAIESAIHAHLATAALPRRV